MSQDNELEMFFLNSLKNKDNKHPLTTKESAQVENVDIDMVYANGDSWAWGSELGDESQDYRDAHSYPGLIAKNLGVELYNNSKPGASNQRVFRTTIHDISKLLLENRKPLVILTWTEVHRFELFETASKQWVSFSNPGSSTNESLTNEIWGKYSTDASNLISLITKFIAIDSFFKHNNVPYIMVTSCGITPESFGKNWLTSGVPTEEFLMYKTLTERINYIGQFTLSSYLRTFNRVKWGLNHHPLEGGHEIMADFIFLQINDRYNITVNK